MRDYEAILIADPQLNEEGLTQLKSQMADLVGRHGGRVQESVFLGKKKLSYRIGRHSEGNYLQVKLQMPPAGLEGFKRMANLIEPVMRMMVVLSSRLPVNNQAVVSGEGREQEEGE